VLVGGPRAGGRIRGRFFGGMMANGVEYVMMVLMEVMKMSSAVVDVAMLKTLQQKLGDSP